MPEPLKPESQIALQAVRDAARLCRDVQSALADGVLSKDDRSPVTLADFGSQALVCRALQDAFPNDPVIGEEGAAALRDHTELLERVTRHVAQIAPEADGDRICGWIDRGAHRSAAPRVWTIDPIDGTKGFLRGEQYAVALALLIEGQVELAALACPNLSADDGGPQPRGVIYTAVRGRGAFAHALDGDAPPQPIRVSDIADPTRARFCESVESGHTKQGQSADVARQLGIAQPPYRIDSQCKYAAVARGSAQIYLRLPTRADYVEKIWDHAAGALVVEEAGGRVTDLRGRPLDFSLGAGLENNRGIVVTNGHLHEAVLMSLHQAGVAG